MRRMLCVIALLLAGPLAACASKASHDPLGGAASSGPCHGSHLGGKALLACVGPALAYVETASSTGSGVLLADGYLVTNADVVDPYPAADLTFPDGTYREDVPVVGIDAFADIAVLGPIPSAADIDAAPLAIGTGKGVDKGADVFLLGYPGEADQEPDPTISRGVLSRVREVKAFDQTYLQTDASIGGGQSGGALVDDEGHLLGISGLEFAEEFALALDGTDVQDAVDRIRAGKGDHYAAVPDASGAGLDHPVDLADELDASVLVVPADSHKRTLQVSVGDRSDVGVAIADLYGDPLLVNQASVDLQKATGDIESESDLGIPVATPTAGGTYEVELPEDIESIILIGSAVPTPLHVDVHTSLPTVVAAASPRQPIQLGQTVNTTFDFFENEDVYTLALHAGDEVEVTARSPQGDMGVEVRAPGSALKDIVLIDDGGGGLYDYDAQDTFKAAVDGTYVFGVFSYDGVVTGYRFSVASI